MDFQKENIYHVYNRGNNRQQVFFEADNYFYFLKKIKKHLVPYVEVIAYCLMPNHFHFMLYISESGQDDLGHNISQAWGTILRSYSQAINNRFNRTGSLFQQKTKAKLLDKKDAPFNCFHYIHQNPVKAKIVAKMEDWKYSSFRDYIGLRKNSMCNMEMSNMLLDIPSEKSLFYHHSYQVQEVLEDNLF